MQCKVILAEAAVQQSLSGVPGVIRARGPGAVTCHSPARPGGGVAVGVAPPAPPCSYFSVACQKIFCQTATKNELTGEQVRREAVSSKGYFEDSIPLLSEHKQHLAFIAKTVCIGGPAWG